MNPLCVTTCSVGTVLASLLLSSHVAEAHGAPDGADTDGDGLADALERELGSDPEHADRLVELQGYASHADGSPAVGTTVRVRDVASPLYEAVADATGAFHIPHWPASVTPTLVLRTLEPGRGCLGAEAGYDRTHALLRDGSGAPEPIFYFGKVELVSLSGGDLFPGPVDLLPPSFDYLTGPTDLALADLDRDGRLDVLVLDATTGQLLTRLGRGDGTFRAGVIERVVSPERWFAVGDVDEDRVPDVVLARSSEQLDLRLGRGDGAFEDAVAIPVSAEQSLAEVELIDVDRDGHQDIVVAVTFAQAIAVLRGTGDGAFDAAVLVATPGRPRRIAAADLDGDEFPELVAECGVQNQIVVCSNRGDGTFAAGVATAIGAWSRDLAVGDLDGDGAADVVVALLQPAVLLLRGAGDGSLGAVELVPVPEGGASIEIVDLDHDGDRDVVMAVADQGTDFDDACILHNPGDGDFVRESFVAAAESDAVAVGDLDRDGFTDLCYGSTFSGAVNTFLADRRGGFRSARRSQLENVGIPARVADLDSDGHPDLLLRASGRLEAWLGDGAGGFESAGTIVHGAPQWIQIVHLQPDGVLDLVTAEGFGASGQLATYTGLGDGRFGLYELFPVGAEPVRFDVARIDGDAYPDAVVLVRGEAGNSTEVWLMRGLPQGRFDAPAPTGIHGSLMAMAVDDCNGDGERDVVVADRFTGFAQVHLNRGDGTFAARRAFHVGSSPLSIVVSDLDADALADLAFACHGEDAVVVFRGLGTGAFSSSEVYPVSARPLWLTAEDVDVDGRLDLLADGTDLSVLFGRSRAFAPAACFVTGSNAGHAVDDFDEDGAPDVLYASGNVSILYNQGLIVDPPAPGADRPRVARSERRSR
jgi:hypothetical protein